MPGAYHDVAMDYYQHAMMHHTQQAIAAAQAQNQSTQMLQQQQQQLSMAMASGMHPQVLPAMPYPYAVPPLPFALPAMDALPMSYFADTIPLPPSVASSSVGASSTGARSESKHKSSHHAIEQRSDGKDGAQLSPKKRFHSSKGHDKGNERHATSSSGLHRHSSKNQSSERRKEAQILISAAAKVRDACSHNAKAVVDAIDASSENVERKDVGSKLLMNFYKAAKINTEKLSEKDSNAPNTAEEKSIQRNQQQQQLQQRRQKQQQQSTGTRTGQSSTGSDGTTSMPSDPSDPSEGSNENYSASEHGYSASSLSDSDKSSEDNNPQDSQTPYKEEGRNAQRSSDMHSGKPEKYCTLESLQYSGGDEKGRGPQSLAASRKRYIEHHGLEMVANGTQGDGGKEKKQRVVQ